jgi:hypothetical protein
MLRLHFTYGDGLDPVSEESVELQEQFESPYECMWVDEPVAPLQMFAKSADKVMSQGFAYGVLNPMQQAQPVSGYDGYLEEPNRLRS